MANQTPATTLSSVRYAANVREDEVAEALGISRRWDSELESVEAETTTVRAIED